MVKRTGIVQRTGSSPFWRAQDFHLVYNQVDMIFVIITILLCTLVATSYQLDFQRAFMALVFAVFLIGAISIRNWMLGEKEERVEEISTLSTYRWFNIIALGLVGFIVIVVAQFSVLVGLGFEHLSSLDFYGRAFGFVAADAEEWFFRGLLLRIFIKFTGEYIISSVLCSGIFTIYHYVVYVILLGMPDVLLAVFVSSLVLCAVCILSKSLTSSVIAHGLVNVGLRVMI
jgi:membrane protease YdiL (CAAX protease family)